MISGLFAAQGWFFITIIILYILPKQLLNYVPSNGQRRVGRQSERWIDNIKNYLNDSDIDYEDAETIAADRVFWRKFVASCN